MSVNSAQEEGGVDGVWLRVRILNSLVFNLRTMVRAGRDSLPDRPKLFRQAPDHRFDLCQRYVVLKSVLD